MVELVNMTLIGMAVTIAAIIGGAI